MIEFTHFAIVVLMGWCVIDAIINWLDDDPTRNKDATKKSGLF